MRRQRCASRTLLLRTSILNATSCASVTMVRSTRRTRMMGFVYRWMSRAQPKGSLCAATGAPAPRSLAPTARRSSTSTPTLQRAASSSQLKQEPRMPKSSPSRSVCRSRTQSGSVVGQPMCVVLRLARMKPAAASRRTNCGIVGQATPGRAPSFMRISCRHYPREPSRA